MVTARRHARRAVIHGAGQLGKSSLAARVSHRRTDLQTIVIYKDHDGGAILAAIATQVGTDAGEILARHRPTGSWDAASFGHALRELLEGPCSTADAGAILLVVAATRPVLDDSAAAVRSLTLHPNTCTILRR